MLSPPLPIEPLLSYLPDDPEIAGEALGVSRCTVLRWRQGRTTTITRPLADRYACRLGVPTASIWLFDWW